VDDDTGAMDRRGGNDFAGWQYHGFDEVVKIAAEKLPYDPVFLKHLLTDDKPEDVLKPHDATEAQQKKAVAWAKAVRAENQLWMRGADCKTHRLGDRVFHQVEGDVWVSYKLEARQKGITGYQFRAPGEWFAELYAAAYSGALQDKHPYLAWIKQW
jgi:hypothetical protein